MPHPLRLLLTVALGLGAASCGGKFFDDDDDESEATCAVADRTLTCEVSEDPDPDIEDDDTLTTVQITLAEGANDDQPRSIEAVIDFAELAFADGEPLDESRLEGLEPGLTHDSDVERVLIHRRAHLGAEPDRYLRVRVQGEVAFDTDGDYDVSIEWVDDPATDRYSGDLSADD